ncbi:M20/M25/M40 family metallo-hydrolase [Phenylobacterium sp. LjRoot225]|uniref:M20/M25/M40 family metallo-hydrolase n=1 Tax=Phenylobacterium sp. LjRoot225 TaxID=3342285 RepID=UPI003F508B7A
MRFLVAAACAAALPAHAQDLTAQSLATEAAAVRDKALSDPTAWRVVESLTSEVGARPVGTPAMARARDWGVATLAALGFENVHVESFTTRAWIRGEESAEVVGPWPQRLQILGLGNSAPTPKGGLTAEIVLFRTYQAMLDQPPGALKGKIAVVTQATPRTQDASSYGLIGVQRTQGPLEAAKRGAVGYLVRSISTADTRLPHTGSTAAPGIPAAALATPDAEQLERLAARGKPVTVRLDMSSSVIAAAPAWNVVGEIRGRERPEEVIVVGGHLDSWDPGTGAIDDGAGIAITTAAARIAGQAQRPRRTLRVVMWGSEEQGGSGDEYAKAHADEIARIVVAGESDLGAGRIWRAALPAGSLDHPAMSVFAATVSPLGVLMLREPPKYGGSDIAATIKAGAPFVQFSQDADRYFDLHHSADDTLDKIKPDELAQNVAVWASFLYLTANSDIDFRAAKP